MDALTLHRAEFAFTITYHYLFPQLTMGLGLLIVVLFAQNLWRKDAVAGRCARFLSKIFGLNFVMGVVTGIPMEFQFGASWSRFSEAAGHIIGQTLAMEGLFAFFLESTFLYFLLFGEKKLGPKLHFLSAVLVFVGSWLSAYFIIVTNAFMQHPVGHRVTERGVELESLWAYLTNPWAPIQFSHTVCGSVVTASMVVAAIGALYTLLGRHPVEAAKLLKTGVIAGFIAAIGMALPTGDLTSRMVAEKQPVTFAAMEGHFHTEDGAGLVIIGQPNMETLTLDNPIVIPEVLSFMTYQRFGARVEGLAEFDKSEWPDNVPLLYYAYHVMVGIGTILMALTALSVLQLWRKKLSTSRGLLWALMLAFPLPYIANTAGWMTAELGRQPWLIHGVMRTKDGYSDVVSEGNALFSLIGFMGLYAFLSILVVLLVAKILIRGIPTATPAHTADAHAESPKDEASP